MANNCKQCFNTHYQPHCHPTTKSLWLCSSVYWGPPHPSRRIMVGGRSRQPKSREYASREFPAFSTGRGNAFCLRHVGDAHHVGEGGYSPCLFGYVTMWVGVSQSDAHQPIKTSVSETKEALYRPMRGASWDEEQTSNNRHKQKASIEVIHLQATGLDARASRVKWPTQFMSHWYGILFIEW